MKDYSDEFALFAKKELCLRFGKGDNSGELVLVGNFMSSYDNNVYNGTFFDSTEPKFILNDGQRHFCVSECEVYRLEYCYYFQISKKI